jgi:hypothetical protein
LKAPVHQRLNAGGGRGGGCLGATLLGDAEYAGGQAPARMQRSS